MDAAISEPSTWRIGEPVIVRGQRWRIAGLTRGTDCTAMSLARVDGARAQTLLIPFDRPRRLDGQQRPRVLRSRRWLNELRRRMSLMRPFGGLDAAARSTVRLMAYQLEPALAMLRHGATRVLIADAVGMGKTVQAGLLLSELTARSELFRGLVIVPAGLKNQWARELECHFQLDASVADASWLRTTTSMRPPDVNPWSLPGLYISSSDFVKRPEVLSALEEVTWDLLVVDEAHSATSGSDRRAAAHAIGVRSRGLVLLTATPQGDDPHEFDALCRIGELPSGGDPILLFRRTRRAADTHEPRRCVVLPVQPSEAEQRMHQLLNEYTNRVWTESARRGDDSAKLAVIVLRKRALSSAASLAVSVRRRMELLAGSPAADTWQLRLPLGDEDPLEDEEPGTVLAAPGLSNALREHRWLSAIAGAARHAAARETKAAFLLRLVGRVAEPVIVFTEYRDTLVRLERAVAASGRATAVLHGGMTPAERSRVQRAFSERDLILMATDAAAEGLNLQSRCRIVVHYELPWRGSRLEQRAGRVDRLGQTKRVHEIALVSRETSESLVLRPLLSRAAHACRTGDDSRSLLDALTESRVAHVVMSHGRTGTGTDGAAFRTTASAHHVAGNPRCFAMMNLAFEAEDEVSRLELQRRAVQYSTTAQAIAAGPVISTIRRRGTSLPDGLVLIYRIALALPDGCAAHEEPLVLHVSLTQAMGQPLRKRALFEIVRPFDIHAHGSESPLPPHLSRGANSHEAALAEAAQRVLRRIAPLHSARAKLLDLRRRGMLSVHTSAAAQLVQAGLFDRRAIRELARRERIRGSLRDEHPDEDSGADPGLAPAAELLAALFITPERQKR